MRQLIGEIQALRSNKIATGLKMIGADTEYVKLNNMSAMELNMNRSTLLNSLDAFTRIASESNAAPLARDGALFFPVCCVGKWVRGVVTLSCSPNQPPAPMQQQRPPWMPERGTMPRAVGCVVFKHSGGVKGRNYNSTCA